MALGQNDVKSYSNICSGLATSTPLKSDTFSKLQPLRRLNEANQNNDCKIFEDRTDEFIEKAFFPF